MSINQSLLRDTNASQINTSALYQKITELIVLYKNANKKSVTIFFPIDKESYCTQYYDTKILVLGSSLQNKRFIQNFGKKIKSQYHTNITVDITIESFKIIGGCCYANKYSGFIVYAKW